MATQKTEVKYIDQSIQNLKSLEILLITISLQHIYIPFESISKLTQLKAISMRRMAHVNNTIVPSDVCNLVNLIYFEMTFTQSISNVPFDCISTNWQELRYFQISIMPQTTYINPDFWRLPNIHTVFMFAEFDQEYFNFSTFNGYSDSLSKVSLNGNHRICADQINIDSSTYFGFGYLTYASNNTVNFTRNQVDSSPLLQFIESFDPCYMPCGGENLLCINTMHNDGICDNNCNNDECGYDGGDCNQLCACDTNLWFNDECDANCNTTECNYDFYQCGMIDADGIFDPNDTCYEYFGSWNDTSDANDTYNTNNTNSTNTVCYSSWTEDDWCDTDCNVASCGFDGGLCNTICGGRCSVAYFYIIVFWAGGVEPFELITEDEVCGDLFGIITNAINGIDEGYNNCTNLYHAMDKNENGVIGFHEALIATANFWGFETTQDHFEMKMNQIDCSSCMKNQSLYYV